LGGHSWNTCHVATNLTDYKSVKERFSVRSFSRLLHVIFDELEEVVVGRFFLGFGAVLK